MEGGRIDHAHHDTMAHRALDELVAMDDAVELALKMTNEEVSDECLWCGEDVYQNVSCQLDR